MEQALRIGKDFTVKWNIFRRTEGGRIAYDLEGKNLVLRLQNAIETVDVQGFAVTGNTIEWVFRGKDQKYVGRYTLILVENQDENGMVTIDKVGAFILVAHTHQETDNDREDVVIETLELSSESVLLPVGEGGSGPVDQELNASSENAIANKTVTQAFTEVVKALREKQDAITDLNAIREGAKKGATAIQKVKTINGQSIEGEGNIEIKGGNEIDVEVDTELSEESSNAIANKTVTAALKNKVDKVDGKQLSTEDFTSLLKAKLDGLSNYDDTSIRNAINSLTTQINTLVSGDASVAIESFNEIIAFLNGIEDSESLDSIIASIEQQIAGKQNMIYDLADIREGAALGKTALQSVPAGYVTTTDLQTEISLVEKQIAGVASAIPTKTSQLNNDSGFTTEEYVNTQVRTAIISALNTEV